MSDTCFEFEFIECRDRLAEARAETAVRSTSHSLTRSFNVFALQYECADSFLRGTTTDRRTRVKSVHALPFPIHDRNISGEYSSSSSSSACLLVSFQLHPISHRRNTYGVVRSLCVVFTRLVNIFCRPGNSTFAAITAIVAANLVLVAYIITSLRDDRAEREAGKPAESRKDR